MHFISLSILVSETSDCNSFSRTDLAVHILIIPLSVNIDVGQGQDRVTKVLEYLRLMSLLVNQLPCYILTHTSNAKSFRNVTLINIRGIAEIMYRSGVMPETHPIWLSLKGND